MVTMALAARKGSDAELAVIVIVDGLGIVFGAVYVTGIPGVVVVLERVPQAVPAHPAPDRVQLTPWFRGSFCTVAEKD
jgi:hypothetical protein